MRFSPIILLLIIGLCCVVVHADDSPAKSQSIEVKLPKDQQELTPVMQMLVLMTFLSFLPAVLLTMTSFTRILIVLSFARQAFGVQNLPPNQVLVGLSFFLTVFVMSPVWQEGYESAYQPYEKGEISLTEAGQRAIKSLRKFMLQHTREKDLALMVYLSKSPPPQEPKDVATFVLIPAFVMSELSIAFQMGFFILIPFLVIDIIVSSTLLSMGMMMLPPITISIPFKILLFVLVDGWHLVVKTLVLSFG